ncbi:metallophosphoesterase family protein [Paenibacillus campi]|uniref:metallophosphoesterase family protein n=1 Tax=Paenibacillus campi TaxID=3106031 RepID=UPI002AFE1DDD|nr:metallophosphoesterase [Paenibacillus sp. SGZ-1014]
MTPAFYTSMDHTTTGQASRLEEQERIASFQVVTDTHLTADPQHLYNRHLVLALNDISKHGQDSLGIMHVGDMTDHGLPAEYAELQRIVALYGQHLPPIYGTTGNHDVGDLGWKQGEWMEQLDGLLSLDGQSLRTLWAHYAEAATDLDTMPSVTALPEAVHKLWLHRLGSFNEATATEGAYYQQRLGGYVFIFLGTERPLAKDCHLSSMQLQWLRQRLEAATTASPGKPIFVFLHQPLKDTVAGSLAEQGWFGVEQDGELKKLLLRYPQVMLFSGHTHWQLNSPHTMHQSAGGAVMFNAASVAYLWTDADEYLEGSQGYYIDIYSAHIVVRGRDFASARWLEAATWTLAYGTTT